jgi:hypothetical protein
VEVLSREEAPHDDVGFGTAPGVVGGVRSRCPPTWQSCAAR